MYVTFDQILLLYLYQHKKISLNLFGTIELEGTIPDPEIIRKEKQLPIDGLKFNFDPHVITDEAFIHFYASEKGRIIPLSASDIEAQLLMARQIVNIGNPYEIAGLGKIVKMDNGKLTILPGFFTIPPISGSGRPTILRERVQQSALPKVDRREEKAASNRKIGQMAIISGAVLAVAFIVWAIFKFVLPMMQGKADQPDVTVSPVAVDTTVPVASVNPVIDSTLILSSDSTLIQSSDSTLIQSSDSTTVRNWKAYIAKSSKKQFADDKLKRYKSFGHNVELEAPDSNRFLIYINLQSSITDTARQRDSLSKFFAYPVTIVPKNP